MMQAKSNKMPRQLKIEECIKYQPQTFKVKLPSKQQPASTQMSITQYFQPINQLQK